MTGSRPRWLGSGWALGLVAARLAVLVAVLSATSLGAQWGRATVSGLVFGDSDTQGLAGAKVELFGDRDDERLREVDLSLPTDAAGKYAFERVPYGRYEFRVSAHGYLTYSIPLYVASDAHTQLHVRLLREAGQS